MASIGLSMIVKNEESRIERYLHSVIPWIDYYSIMDTGSTDNTIAVIRSTLADMPGRLIEEPFVDFGTTRNRALAEARKSPVDYLLLPDADMELVVENIDWREGLFADGYMIEIRRASSLTYRLAMLLRRAATARYIGVTHEYLNIEGRRENLDGIWIRDYADGTSRADKFTRDIELLSRELKHDPKNPRTVFYLAQSHRDLGALDHAVKLYLARANMGGWIEEVYISLINIARLQERLGRPFHETLAVWRKAMQAVPHRAEAYHGAARLCRMADCMHEAYAIAKHGVLLRQPDGLFIEPWIYQWGMLDEYAVAAYWAGEPGASLLACDAALAQQIDPATRARITKNAEFAHLKI